MKIDIISDIHLDFYLCTTNPQHPKFNKDIKQLINIIVPTTQGDTLIIAGDLGHINNQIRYLLIELKKYYKNIIITYGNHDMYLTSKNISSKFNNNSENRIKDLKQICNDLNIYFLNGSIIEIEGIKFGGSCSWYNLDEEHISIFKNDKNDGKYIFSGYGRPRGMYSSYSRVDTKFDTQAFWKQEEEKLNIIADKGCDIFITHVPLLVTDSSLFTNEYMKDYKDISFYSNNEFDMVQRSGAKYYIHGHIHDKLDYIKDGINIICNPLGYPGDHKYTHKRIIIGE